MQYGFNYVSVTTLRSAFKQALVISMSKNKLAIRGLQIKGQSSKMGPTTSKIWFFVSPNSVADCALETMPVVLLNVLNNC